MGRSWKIAFVRARHDPSLAKIPDAACNQLFMTGPRSVLHYWQTVTEGWLDFLGSAVFPWVDIPAYATPKNARAQLVADAVAAVRAQLGDDLSAYDSYVVLIYPGAMWVPNPMAGQFKQPDRIWTDFTDGGATAAPNGKPACAVNYESSDLTFMFHESGHGLGFEHSYGLLNNGVDWDGKAPHEADFVYGDPYDVMSSASFGTRSDPTVSTYWGSPVFFTAPPAGWWTPGRPSRLPDSAYLGRGPHYAPTDSVIGMGPAPARAHIHLWEPKAIPEADVRHLPMPTLNAAPVRVRLQAANAREHGTRLIAIHPAGEPASGEGRVYLEYRDRSGWDAGLDEGGTDLARVGVVAHTLTSAANAGVRPWYRGHINVPVELDSDLAVAASTVVVRVVAADPQQRWVDLEIDSAFDRTVHVDIHREDVVLAETWNGLGVTPCGDLIRTGFSTIATRMTFTPTAVGYGGSGIPEVKAPKVTWTVGGTTIPAGTWSGNIAIGTSDGEFNVDFILDPVSWELQVTGRGGERYTAEVKVAVSEADGAYEHFATATFNPLGWENGVHPGDRAKLDQCLHKIFGRAGVRAHDHLIPLDRIDPPRRDRVIQANLERLGPLADALRSEHPAEAAAIDEIVALERSARQQ
ncbi:hypothetical protein [Hamadaea tsunoensis]|uniref:hypothetical protein n=1 Tax=Hamadaea tsunoensis TaxID=53368 RepID=UPI0004242ECD|nr:hypothetical protein [Hamadaea tsunoensis]